MTRIWNRPLSLVIPEPVGDELDRLARDSHRRPKDHAALLLIDAIRRASSGDASLTALAAEFETEGHHAFGEADAPSAGLVRRIVLQTRGEAWLQAATRLREATATTEAPPFEPRVPMG